jgi:N-acetylglucosamine-6-phosphate deacetylase
MQLQEAGELGGSRILGLHLEGPFLNRQRPGAMLPEQMHEPGVAKFRQLFGSAIDLIKQVTLAPELPGAAELIAFLLQKGIAVQAGHTNASLAEAETAFALGVDSICHTFNAARPIHHRDPGILTAALLEKSVYCEAICDLEHLDPAIIRLIYQNKGPDKMIVVSDSTTATGLPDGTYDVGGHPLIVKNGIKRRQSGALSGGSCYLDQSVRNLAACGLPLADAFYMASTTPARRLGLARLGSIRSGNQARLAAYSHDLEPVFTLVGDHVYHAGDT